MQVDIRSHRLELAPDARRSAERRLRLALGRHAARVERASVTLLAGGRGAKGESSRCRIRARLREGSSVVVEDSASDLDIATENAAWRLEQFLDRQRVREWVNGLRS